MPTTTRTDRTSSASSGRFKRSAPAPRRTSRVPALRRRREPEPTGLKKLASSVQPLAAAKKAKPSSKKGMAGGLALAATAAGVLFKNRDKLPGMGRKDDDTTASSANNASAPPATPAV